MIIYNIETFIKKRNYIIKQQQRNAALKKQEIEYRKGLWSFYIALN